MLSANFSGRIYLSKHIRAQKIHELLRRNLSHHRSIATYCKEYPLSKRAPREVPTPLVFVSSSALGADSRNGIETFAQSFSEKGFSCLDIDMTLAGAKEATSSDILEQSANDLHQLIKSTGHAFPPVVISRSSACLVSQSYISSYSASGLVLISPPITSTYVSNVLPARLKEFDYEPHFPLMVISTLSDSKLPVKHRLLAMDVDSVIIQDEDLVDEKKQHMEVIQKLEEWLDAIGI